jgi:short-subunit dehydrogenase
MIEQGHGHIVNTSSGVGLAAPPLVVPYAATKHAVVGLSTGLRPEAALHGVRVSVLCPGAVETAILDRPLPEDLPPTASRSVTARQYLKAMHQKPMPADAFARTALKQIAANRSIIVVPRSAKSLWYLQRLSPALVERISRAMAARVVRDLVQPSPEH